MAWRVGIDIGGTFTDVAMVEEQTGRIGIAKVLTTPRDFGQGVINGITQGLAKYGISAADVSLLSHATTVVTNALLEKKGARAGFIATKGFRDILELRRSSRPDLYDLFQDGPGILIPRRYRYEITERIDAQGQVVTPLADEELPALIETIRAEKLETIAVSLMFSFLNDAHERRIGAALRAALPGVGVFLSCEVLPEIREFERASTTGVCAYVGPLLASYLERLSQATQALGLPSLMVMGSSGGVFDIAEGLRMPAMAVESGPAAGVIAAQLAGRQLGRPDLISFDMGGTTAKASMVEEGEIARAQEYAVGAGIMIGSRLLTGAGYTLKVPAIDLAEVGAGGGSHVWIDPGGALQAGPESAGAFPGPVCYDKGGEAPTITDANVLLGYINPGHLVGGAVKLNADKARAVFEEKIAKPLGMTVERAAYGAHLIAASNMIRAIKAVSTERGRDPREFSLFAFGGNGPLFAAGMAAALGIARVIVPPSAGLFSSFGLLYADVEHHYARTFRRLLRQADLGEIDRAWTAMAGQANGQLAEEGFTGTSARLKRSAALHYKGQSYELTVPVPDGPIDARMVTHLEEAFGQEHERTYGHRAGPDEPVELVAIQLVGSGLREGSGVPQNVRPSRVEATGEASRRAWFGDKHGWMETPVVSRADLAEAKTGPLIIDEYDTTCVVPPGARAERDSAGNIVITL